MKPLSAGKKIISFFSCTSKIKVLPLYNKDKQIMKTLENIEIYDINTYKNVVTVEYGMEGCAVTLQINEDTLVDYIEANELNTVEFINYLECDGYDEKKVCPINYLADNLFDVVKSYLEDNHAE